jgi:hypothetical protein
MLGACSHLPFSVFSDSSSNVKETSSLRDESQAVHSASKNTHSQASGSKEWVESLLPEGIRDPNGWSKDIDSAFGSLKVPKTTENGCAVIAVVEQESSFKAEPTVAGLPAIIRKELKQRQDKYKIPGWMVDKALEVKSPKGGTYNQRIDALRSENDVNRLFDDMTSELPLGKQLLANYNPVKTGGPMQVSVAFAKDFVKHKRYPYAYDGSLRSEVFSRRGGLFFGIAYLLSYPVRYSDIVYRFADYNAGHYASRNAAFQRVLHSLTGRDIDYDGDLLRYHEGEVSKDPSQTLEAVWALSQRLDMTRTDIERDMQLEKSADFSRSALFEKTFQLAKKTSGRTWSYEEMPDIHLNSPKFTRSLTTSIFAHRVKDRYETCLNRAGR